MQRIKKIIRKAPKPEKLTAIFVYGTLMSNHFNNRLLRDIPFKKAFLLDFQRIWEDCHYFPVIEYKEGFYTNGELYYINDEKLKSLDNLESAPYMYNKIKVIIYIENLSKVEAFVYYPSDEILNRWKAQEKEYNWDKLCEDCGKVYRISDNLCFDCMDNLENLEEN